MVNCDLIIRRLAEELSDECFADLVDFLGFKYLRVCPKKFTTAGIDCRLQYFYEVRKRLADMEVAYNDYEQ